MPRVMEKLKSLTKIGDKYELTYRVRKKNGRFIWIKDNGKVVKVQDKIALVGRNGAGKTTTMKMILGLLQADSGEIYVAGEKVGYKIATIFLCNFHIFFANFCNAFSINIFNFCFKSI